jgi:hypothetical protein
MDKKSPRVIGRHVYVDLPDLGFSGIEAKVDTGAFRTVIHCDTWKEVEVGGKTVLQAVFNLDGTGPKTIFFDDYFQRDFKSSFGETERRYCVHTLLQIGKKKIRSSVSLSNRSDMKFQVLIGRKTLLRKFVVDVSKKFI